MKHDINKKVFLEYSLDFFNNSVEKMKEKRLKTLFKNLKQKSLSFNFENNSKKIFFKLAFASLIISFLKIKKNFTIFSFKKIKDSELLRQSIGIGNYGLTRCMRKKIKEDVEKEFLMKRFKRKCERKKKVDYTSIGITKLVESEKEKMKIKSKVRSFRNNSIANLNLHRRKNSSISSGTSMLSLKRNIKNKNTKDVNLRKGVNKSCLELDFGVKRKSNTDKNSLFFNQKRRGICIPSLRKMKSIDKEIKSRETSRSRSFLNKIKKANFEDKTLNFRTLGNKLAGKITFFGESKESKVELGDKEVEERSRVSGYFEEILGRHAHLDQRLKGIKKKFNIGGE